jgi:hypothetical protein
MQILNHIFSNSADTILFYLITFSIVSVALFYLAKLRSSSAVVLNTLQIIKMMLSSKLGSKADALVDIWIEGLKKIQDGEFSREDGVDQFVRYVRLAAVNKGVLLTDDDVQHITQLVSSTLDIFIGKKQSEISLGVNKFNAMNVR